MASIYDLSWNEISFLSKLKLLFKARKQAKEKTRSSDPFIRAEGYSSLSSAYYSIAGTAYARKKTIFENPLLSLPYGFVWCFTWIPLGLFCRWKMLSTSNKTVNEIGYAKMTPDQCDIRQSILRRRGHYFEAENCIKTALKKTLNARTHADSCTRGLPTSTKKGFLKKAEKEIAFALEAASEAEFDCSLQAARIYKYCAKLISACVNNDIINPELLMKKAKNLALKNGSKDQILKIG
jgi:hypothetical protein